MAKKRKNQIAGQFLARPGHWSRAQPAGAEPVPHLALMRIEVEQISHGGAENGKLPITYKQFEEWGTSPFFVACALRGFRH